MPEALVAGAPAGHDLGRRPGPEPLTPLLATPGGSGAELVAPRVAASSGRRVGLLHRWATRQLPAVGGHRPTGTHGHVRAGRRDAGAAVAEVALVGGFLALVAVALLQLGLALHVRNTLTLAAQDGARWGANADVGVDQAAVRAVEVAGRALPRLAVEPQATLVDAGGVTVVEVVLSTRLPVVGWLGPDHALRVVGHSVAEGQP